MGKILIRGPCALVAGFIDSFHGSSLVFAPALEAKCYDLGTAPLSNSWIRIEYGYI